MAEPVLAARLHAGETLISGWSALPEPLVAEAVARTGFDCVTLDMQHGLHDVGSVVRSIGAVMHAGKPVAVRVPVGDYALAARVLDMGAEAVIAPMINSAADARAFIATTKYPPVGERSWGPTRVLTLRGTQPQAHLEAGNRTSLTLAMIETSRALGALDDILAVPGVDGVFIGPSDLSVSFSDGARIAPFDASLDDAVRRIIDGANAAGKVAGAFAANAERARIFRDWGCRFIALGTDQMYLAGGAAAMLAGLAS